jgi:hypothetical protein
MPESAFAIAIKAERKAVDRLITICKVVGMTDAETDAYLATGKLPDRLREQK